MSGLAHCFLMGSGKMQPLMYALRPDAVGQSPLQAARPTGLLSCLFAPIMMNRAVSLAAGAQSACISVYVYQTGEGRPDTATENYRYFHPVEQNVQDEEEYVHV